MMMMMKLQVNSTNSRICLDMIAVVVTSQPLQLLSGSIQIVYTNYNIDFIYKYRVALVLAASLLKMMAKPFLLTLAL